MESAPHYAVIAVPLSRPEIVDFLQQTSLRPRGTKLRVVGQRPSPEAESAWIRHLIDMPNPAVADLLALDDPHRWLVETFTDRLVPVESLARPKFLTRDLGGWVANYFGVVELPARPWPDDPLLDKAEILTDYGPRISFLGGDATLIQTHLPEEMDGDVGYTAAMLGRLQSLRERLAASPMAYIDRLNGEIVAETYFRSAESPPLPKFLLYDELLHQMTRLELYRRAALANGEPQTAETILAWQHEQAHSSGLRLILQGEYIVGRHRRSAVLIAPDLGVVIKQPAPEPLHDIALGARLVQGRIENWPVTVNGGRLIMPRGRVRLIVEEGIIPRLSQVFDHRVLFSLVLGLTIEPYIAGMTVQDWVLADHSRLTPALYEEIVLHQQVCEILEIDNNDWHAPNFVRRAVDGKIVHIDWGAARPLERHEFNLDARLARLNQVSNMAFSFKSEPLATRLKELHRVLTGDEGRMERLRRRARRLVEDSGLNGN